MKIRRLVAYWLDFVTLAAILVGFQGLLYLTTAGFPFDYLNQGYQIELWVLATISLPVWLYFILCESKKQQTLGKRLLNLKVVDRNQVKPTWKQILLRTAIKLLPWELTHLIILVPEPWYSIEGTPATESFIYLPNAIMLIYIIALLVGNGRQALQDYVANTMVVERRW
jgi:uncharacterized RDD family membrane protein YckC